MAQNIEPRKEGASVGATPFNTPLVSNPLTAASAARPGVATVEEDDEEEEGQNPASLLASNPALVNLVQSKLNTLIGKPSGYIESLSPAVKRRIEGLKGIQVEHAKIENEFQLEILELEKKFAKKYAPLYARRSDIISGKAEPTAEEIAAGEATNSDDEDEDDDEEEARVTELDDAGKEKESDIKGIPQFWLTALQNHSIIGEQITDRDEEALKFLTDIKLEYLESKQAGFKLLFYFDKNEFFDDAVLEKTYYYQEEVGYGGDFVYDRAEGHEIKWKEDKDLTKKIEIKKQRNKSTNRTRVVRKVSPADSFFNFFKPPQPPSMEDLEEDEVDAEELEALDEKLEIDYQIGEDLKERIIPRAIDYFTGKALEFDELDEDLDEDFDDEDDDEDDDDEDDVPRRAPAPSTSQDPAECKQQ